jgi:hypothetical protein
MDEFNVTQGLILAEANEQPIEANGRRIEIQATVEWLIRQ